MNTLAVDLAASRLEDELIFVVPLFRTQEINILAHNQKVPRRQTDERKFLTNDKILRSIYV